jgi:hypothetical protein
MATTILAGGSVTADSSTYVALGALSSPALGASTNPTFGMSSSPVSLSSDTTSASGTVPSVPPLSCHSYCRH